MTRLMPKFLLAVGAPLMFTACATILPPQPPSLELPKPPSDLRAARKGSHVTLMWTPPSETTDRQRIRSLGATRICRGRAAQLPQCGIPVAEVPAQPTPDKTQSSKQKVTRSYVDALPAEMQGDDASAFVTYAVEVLNTGGRGAGLSNQVRVSLVRTLPPPGDFAAHVTGQGIVLTWTNNLPAAGSPELIHYVYRVYRRQQGSSQQTLVGEASAGVEPNLSFTDSNFEWEKIYEYRAETDTVIPQQNRQDLRIEGDDTPEIKVFAHDVFPPAVPSGLQAVASGPGQKNFIDLVWAPVTDVDLEGYIVYRHEDGTNAVKLNAEPVSRPAYRDMDVASGKRYFYSVSAVDVRGNESARSEEASEAVP